MHLDFWKKILVAKFEEEETQIDQKRHK